MSGESSSIEFPNLKNVDENVVKMYFKFIERVAEDSGFSDDQLHETWMKILQLSFSPLNITPTIYHMIPNKNVSPKTIDYVFRWAFLHCNSKNKISTIKAILKWLTALVQYKICKKESMQHLYYMLLEMLAIKKIKDEVGHLIYLLTEHHLISSYTVNRILILYEQENDNPTILAILSQFKRLKPHLLDTDIQIISNEIRLLPELTKALITNFQLTSERLEIKLAEEKGNFSNWKTQVISFKQKELYNILYISELKLSETFRECYRSNIFYPGTTFEAILYNKYGFIYLLLTNKECQTYVNEYIRRKLLNIENNLNKIEDKQSEEFLKKLYQLQKFYRQEFDVIQQFLKRNFLKWNGSYYIPEILNLIKNIIIHDYKEFFDSILEPLYDINISQPDINLACRSLNSLAWIIYNNIKYLQDQSLIPQSNQSKPSVEGILKTINCFKHFYQLFVNLFYDNLKILHEIVDDHLLLSSLNTEFDFTISNELFQRILINSDYILINKVSNLILRKYITTTDGERLTKDSSIPLHDILQICIKNICDSYIFLKSFKCPSIDRVIMNTINIKHNFRVRKNFTFMPIIYINDGKYNNNPNRYLIRQQLEYLCEDYIKLLHLVSK